MELQSGSCSFCRISKNSKVIPASVAKKCYKIIGSLFSTRVLNADAFEEVQSCLKFCPICYHKLIILESTSQNLEGNTRHNDEDSYSRCCICKTKKHLFRADNWPLFKEMFEDFPYVHRKVVACSECIFYLELRYDFKTKLFSKHPQLKVKLETRKRITRDKTKISKFASLIRVQSTPRENSEQKRMLRKRVVIEISSDSDNEEGSSEKSSINFASLKKFKPLKSNQSLTYNNIVRKDPKLINQITYVLLNVTDLSKIFNNISVDDDSISIKSTRTRRPCNSLPKETKTKKILVVTLPKMTFEQHKLKLQNNGISDDLAGEQGCSGTNTRKSVSCADDEDDYFRRGSDSTDSNGRANNKGSPKNKKYKPGPFSRRKKYIDIESRIENSAEDGMQKRKVCASSLELENDAEIINSKIKHIIADLDEEETGNGSKSIEDQSKKEKPKPLSKKKKINVIADISFRVTSKSQEGTDEAGNVSDSHVEDTEKEETDVKAKSKDESIKEKPKPLSKQKQFRETASRSLELDNERDIINAKRRNSKESNVSDSDAEDAADRDKGVEATEATVKEKSKKEKPKPLSKKKKSNVDPDISFNITSESEEESDIKGKSKKEKPKPLSKKKKPNVGADISFNITSESEEDADVKGKSKKEKPKPLSKKKKPNLDTDISSESEEEADVTGKSKKKKKKLLFKRIKTNKQIVSASDTEDSSERDSEAEPLSQKKRLSEAVDNSLDSDTESEILNATRRKSDQAGNFSDSDVEDTEKHETDVKDKSKDKSAKSLSMKKQVREAAGRSLDSENEGDIINTERRNSKESNVSDSDVEDTAARVKGVEATEATVKEKSKREKPKPLSKKKRSNVEAGSSINITGDISELDADVAAEQDKSKTDTEGIRDDLKKVPPKALFQRRQSMTVENVSLSDEDDSLEADIRDKSTKYKAKPLSKKRKSPDSSIVSNKNISDADESNNTNLEAGTEKDACSNDASNESNDQKDKSPNGDMSKSGTVAIDNVEAEEDCDPSNNISRKDISTEGRVLETKQQKISDGDAEKSDFTSKWLTTWSTKKQELLAHNDEVSRLVGKYLNESIEKPIDTNNGDGTRVDQRLDGENKESDEVTTDNETVAGGDGKIAKRDSNSFNSGDRNEDIELTEDEDNLVAILSDMMPDNSDNASLNEKDKDDDSREEVLSSSNKRKRSDDELNSSSMEKKKKKVTFCDDDSICM